MSNELPGDANRWEELQASRLLFGLSPEEQTEFEYLARQFPARECESFERVVGAVDVAWSESPPASLPEHLRRAIRVQAEQELKPRHNAAASVIPLGTASAERATSYLPWVVAAACLALSLFLWVSNRPASTAVPSVAQLRAELIATAPDLVTATWTAGPTPIAGATGDVVWSEQRQRGFMRFRGLSINAPTDEQYQLWIFDKNQSDKTPIDGGVFDIGAAGEVVVPIDAKLRVQRAFMFAVTIEKPGGVVVSSRERLPLLAKVE